MAIYDPTSRKAEEFINDAEIRETLAYAEENKRNLPLIDAILEKRDREAAGPTAPAHGLTMMGIEYGSLSSAQKQRASPRRSSWRFTATASSSLRRSTCRTTASTGACTARTT